MTKGVIVKYECAICIKTYDTLEEAKQCFDRGIPKSVIPKGTILGLGLDNTVFVVAKFNKYGATRHQQSYLLWGFRDKGLGDNTGTSYCGDDLSAIQHLLSGKPSKYYSLKQLKIQAKYNKPQTNIPAFHRALEFCIKKNLPLQYWDGTKIKKIDVLNPQK